MDGRDAGAGVDWEGLEADSAGGKSSGARAESGHQSAAEAGDSPHAGAAEPGSGGERLNLEEVIEVVASHRLQDVEEGHGAAFRVVERTLEVG